METEKETTQMMSVFAKSIMDQKYAHTKPDGTKESWEEIAERVVTNVTSALPIEEELKNKLTDAIKSRKFIPGGRYLRCAGLPYHPINNCLLFRADDSREGWADLMHKVSMSLMSGGGIGVVYSDIRAKNSTLSKTGGKASGPIPLMQIINEVGRGIMNAGERRCALWSGLHWNHKDALEFTKIKDWSEEVRYMKQQDYSFPATLDMTNISVILDDDFFEAYKNNDAGAQTVYWSAVKQMLQHSEPGFSIDVGNNRKENLRNAPVSGDTYVLTNKGYRKIRDIVDKPVTVHTGKQWANTVFKKTRENDDVVTVIVTGRKEITCSKDHPFILSDGSRVEAQHLQVGSTLLSRTVLVDGGLCEPNAYTLGLIYGDGYFCKEGRAELALCGKKEKLLPRLAKTTSLDYTSGRDKRGILRLYFKKHPLLVNCDKSTFPEEIFNWSAESKKNFLEGLLDTDGNDFGGGCRLSSSKLDFLRGTARLAESLGYTTLINKGSNGAYKGTPTWMLIIKGATSTLTCERVTFTDAPDVVYKVVCVEESGKEDVYCCDVGVDEHSFVAEGIVVSNCSEITSEDDSDVCNLGSINLARVGSIEEMRELVELGTLFLLAGTEYSHFPTEKSKEVKNKNRRLGLGIMGIHEWLLSHGYSYAPCEALEEYLKVYSTSGEFANKWADRFGLSRPKKTRALAPVGSIGIIGETTTSIEPIFCVAYKRRYFKEGKWFFQYVIDPTAKRLIDKGVPPEKIEDSYSLAQNVEKRVAFQAWVQQYVDHAISSTINLPAWGTEYNNEKLVESFGNMLMKYLPKLRGITVYADGSRSGQPLNPVKYSTAIKHIGEIIEESGDICDISGKGGSCGG